MSYKKQLYTLSTCELADQISYFGLFAVLVIKLNTVLHLATNTSLSIYAFFMAIVYASMFLAGFISDKWLKQIPAIGLGTVLLIIGNITLISNQLNTFSIGLSFVVLGTALFKVNCTSSVGLLPYENHQQQEQGFVIFYSFMNTGAFISPIIYGLSIEFLGWHWAFIFSSLVCVLILILFLSTFGHHLKNILSREMAYALITLIAFMIICDLGFNHISIANDLVVLVFLISFFILITIGFQQHAIKRHHILALVILNVGTIFFFACSFQVASSMTLFIHNDVKPHIGGWTIPTPIMTSLDPLFVVLLAPMAKKLWGSEISKLAFGILLGAIAFFILYIATFSQSHETQFALLVLAYVFLGGGEIAAAPAVLSAIGKYAPENLKSTLTGFWYLAIAFSGFLSGQLSKIDPHFISASSPYAQGFIETAIIAVIGFILMLIAKPFYKRLTLA